MTYYAHGPRLAVTATDWFHGTGNPQPFSRFDFGKTRGEFDPDQEEGRQWNSRLGSHFTTEHQVASELARGDGGGHVYHVDLDMKNPKHYRSEFDLGEEAHKWARKNQGYSYSELGMPHAGRSAWADALNDHPHAQDIADGFRSHLQTQGHDGITYGNEYEGTRGHKSAIIFHPSQASIGHAHGGYEACDQAAPCAHCGEPIHQGETSCPECHEPAKLSATAYFQKGAEQQGPKTYRWTQTYQGPEGYEDRERSIQGPLYHGGGARHRDGQQIKPGRKVNPWGDEVGKSQHVYFTTDKDTAASYAQQSGGHVFQVEPTGDFKLDHNEGDFKTQHPMNVVRKLDRSEWSGPGKTAAASATAYFRQTAGVDDDYRMMHKAPGPHDSNERWDQHTGTDPEDHVQIYRSADHGVHDINQGDWVSVNSDYAHQHGRHHSDSNKDWPVLTASVPAKHIWTDMNDENEQGYHGPPIRQADFHHPDLGIVSHHDARALEDEHKEQGIHLLSPGRGPELHTGAAVHLAPEDHAFVHDKTKPIAERAQRLRDNVPFKAHRFNAEQEGFEDAASDADGDAMDLHEKAAHPNLPTHVVLHSHQGEDHHGISWAEGVPNYTEEEPDPADFERHNFGQHHTGAAKGTDNEGHEAELDEIDGWHHADGSVSHDDGTVISDHPVKMTAALAAELQTEAAAVDHSDGVMIAFVPPREIAEQIAQEDGQPADDLHITLAYLGNASDYTREQLGWLPELVGSWAARQKPTTIRIGGVGTFNSPSEGQHVLWAAADIPDGAQLHSSLAAFLDGHGYRLPSEHGWTPHLTLAYVGPHHRFMPRVAEHSWEATEVVTEIGDKRTPAILGTGPRP